MEGFSVVLGAACSRQVARLKVREVFTRVVDWILQSRGYLLLSFLPALRF